MRLLPKLPFALVLCGVLAASSPSFSASPERTALLERVRKAMPPTLPLGKLYGVGVGQILLASNPGKEAQIAPVVTAYGTCVTKAIEGIDFNAAAVAGMDKAGFTDEELLKIASFYETPQIAEFYRTLVKAAWDGAPPETYPTPNAETMALLQPMAADPVFSRAQQVVKSSTDGALAKAPGLADCAAAAGSAAEAAGLTLP